MKSHYDHDRRNLPESDRAMAMTRSEMDRRIDEHFAFEAHDDVAGAEHDEEGAGLLAPMPGKVIALLAQPGAAVDKGAPLLVLEAMKMEHTISAPRAGTVKAFRVAARENRTQTGASPAAFA